MSGETQSSRLQKASIDNVSNFLGTARMLGKKSAKSAGPVDDDCSLKRVITG